MASPVDASRVATNIATAATSHNINVGSPTAGTLLLVFVRFTDPAGTVGFTGYTATVATQQYNGDASNDETSIYYRVADGAEGASDVMTTSNSVKLAAICWQITGYLDPATAIPLAGGWAIGTTTANTADSPSRTNGILTEDALWIALSGGDGESAYTAQPSGYSNLVVANSGTAGAVATNCFIAGASKQATANSDNPGVWTHAAHSTGWAANTVIVRPSSAVTSTKAGWAVVDGDGFGVSAFVSGSIPGPASSRRQRRANRYLTNR